MAIPEAQLQTWSHQGSVTQSKNTYATIKAALEDVNAKYTNRNFKVFLQGSYCNDTNIYSESDVDVVIRYNGSFFRDLSKLTVEDKAAYQAHYSAADYGYNDFKAHVQAALKIAFKDSVKPNKRAINVQSEGSRRNADVIVAFEYRRYYKFKSSFDEIFDTGIGFIASHGTLIANYPKQHSENCTTKHQATQNNFKPLVRIFKNMRSKLVDDGSIKAGAAPSYFIEGLLYNIPNDKFSGNYGEMVFSILSWLYQTADRTNFVCANQQYYLLRDDVPTCWAIADGTAFIDAVIGLWDKWT